MFDKSYKIHMKETTQLYNRMTESCFNSCINTFRSNTMDSDVVTIPCKQIYFLNRKTNALPSAAQNF